MEIKIQSMSTEEPQCVCGLFYYLVAAVVTLSLTSMVLLCLSIYFYKKTDQVSGKIVRNRSRSFAFGEHCKINSFTCLQLKNGKEHQATEQTCLTGKTRPRILSRVQNRPGHVTVSNSSSGNFKRFEPRMFKLRSKLSLGRSNTISHSSYNSANEELEFDLYDYGHEHIEDDIKEPFLKNNWEMEDFSMTETVPTKLFPSDDTLVHINEVKSCSKISSMNESPIPARRGDYNRNIIESITSDLTASIMSEMNLLETDGSKYHMKKGQIEGSILNTLENPKQDHTPVNIQDLVVLHRTSCGEEKTETMLERNHVWATVQQKISTKTFPPITLIEELELWDDD